MPLSGQLCGTANGGSAACPGFLLPFGCRRSLVGHPFPAGGLGVPHGRLTGPCHQVPDPNGVVTLHMYEMRPGRVPSIPRGRWCSHGRNGITDRHLPLPCGQSLYPGAATISGVKRHEASLRVHCIHPSDLPLACGPRMEREPLGFSPELQTPPLLATHVEVGTGT